MFSLSRFRFSFLVLSLLLLVFAAHQARAFDLVVIDPGHGGHDRGGVPGQRIPEKMMTLDVSLRLNAILRKRGIKTVMTRRSDVFVSLPGRVAIGNRYRNALFVSVHFNSAQREGAAGYETFWYSGRSSYKAAYYIQRNLMRTHRTENRGVKRRGFYVIRHSRNPSVLVECGFLTNRREAALCRKAAHRQRIAEAIAVGIIQAKSR